MHAPRHPNARTRIHRQYVIFIAVPGQQGFVNVPQYLVIRTLAVLFIIMLLLLHVIVKKNPVAESTKI